MKNRHNKLSLVTILLIVMLTISINVNSMTGHQRQKLNDKIENITGGSIMGTCVIAAFITANGSFVMLAVVACTINRVTFKIIQNKNQ